jgi:hypothetical protein
LIFLIFWVFWVFFTAFFFLLFWQKGGFDFSGRRAGARSRLVLTAASGVGCARGVEQPLPPPPLIIPAPPAALGVPEAERWL